jgi:hypothetical protein
MAARRWIGPWWLPIAYGFFFLAGVYTVLSVPRMLHPASVAALAIGITAAFLRRLRGKERTLTDVLRRRLVLLPFMFALSVIGVLVFERGREMWLASRLPAPPKHASNALLIVMDTVRADTTRRLLEEGRLPNLAALSAKGARFENA